MSARWMLTLRVEQIPFTLFDKIFYDVKKFLGLYSNALDVLTSDSINRSIEIKDFEIDASLSFFSDALDYFKAKIWEFEYIPFKFGAEQIDRVYEFDYGIEEYKKFKKIKNDSNTIELFKIFAMVYSESIFKPICITRKVLNYLKSKGAIDIDQKIKQSEIDNAEMILIDYYGDRNKEFYDDYEKRKDKICKEYVLSDTDFYRIEFLYKTLVREFYNDKDFTKKEIQLFSDMPLLFTKHSGYEGGEQEYEGGDFYIISETNFLE